MRTAIAGTAQALVTRQPVTAQPAVPPGPSATPTPTPTALPTTIVLPPARPEIPLPAIPEAACVPPENPVEVGLVAKIVDGDTIDVDLNGKVRRVRYIGVDAPEATIQVEPFGEEATALNRALVEGQAVLLVRDVSEKDRFGRLLRYVFVGDLFVNYELVRQGFAQAATFPPDVACQETYRTAETEARENSLGLWGK
jgi:micrococcal nuclease